MKNFYEVLLDKASTYKDETAFIFRENKISYSKLINQIDKVADSLVNECGVRGNDLVAIIIPRSLDHIYFMLAVLKIKATYCIINNEEPEIRMKYMINNSGVQYIVTTKEKLSKFSSEHIIEVIHHDNYIIIKLDNTTNIQLKNKNIAYILYTSGSTGKPKGVMVSHESLLLFTDSINEVLKISAGDNILCNTSFSFDISILESLVALVYGATITLTDNAQQNNVKVIRNIIVDHKIDILQMTPTLIGNFLNYFRDDISFLSGLKKILVGGEPFPPYIYEKLNVLKNIDVYNMYGPTEATIWATYKKIESDFITIGKPLKGYNVYIMNDGKEVEKGQKGEIFISGIAVASGYINDAKKTNDKFLADIYNKKMMMYRTGDLGKQLNNNEIVFLGRNDNQIKINGHRIELGEIEEVIKGIEGINDSVVIKAEYDGLSTLVCYYLASIDIEPLQIRKELLNKLPGYMVPKRFYCLAKFPYNNRGKVDRNAIMMNN